MNLKKTFKTFKGDDYKKSFPKDQEDAKQPETLGNVLLNALSMYPVKRSSDIFLVSKTGIAISEAIEKGQEEFSLTPVQKKFISDVLVESTFKQEGEDKKGIYFANLISQILAELGMVETDY